jgi:hypothetical protein
MPYVSPPPTRDTVQTPISRCQLGPIRKAFLALTTFFVFVLAPVPSRAFEVDLVSAGIRARVSSADVLGKEQPEAFSEYDVWAAFRLPWKAYGRSNWGVETRLLTSAGYLQGAGSTALVVSVLPLIAFGTRDGRFAVDLGAGVAVLSQTKFAEQDFGGPVQGALTFGMGIPVYKRFGVGYRFMHYSDWGAYGDTIGADLHMVELIYRF